jgi:hypothetical protein
MPKKSIFKTYFKIIAKVMSNNLKKTYQIPLPNLEQIQVANLT